MERIQKIVNNIVTLCANCILKFTTGFLVNSHPEWNVRPWSNREIRKYGKLYHGDMINIGAWKDGDKEKGFYRDYFPNATSYTIANYGG